MYSPYDKFVDGQEQYWGQMSSVANFAAPSRIIAGATLATLGVGTIIGGGIGINRLHMKAMDENINYAKRMGKMTNSSWYKQMTTVRGFMDFYLPGAGDWAMNGGMAFRPMTGFANQLDNLQNRAGGKEWGWGVSKSRWENSYKEAHVGWSRGIGNEVKSLKGGLKSGSITQVQFDEGFADISKRAKLGMPALRRGIKLPIMAPLSALTGATNEMQESGHSSGMLIGGAREGAMLAGGGVGMQLGRFIGMLGGPIGSLVGAIVGGVAGAMVGSSMIDSIGWMSSKGKQWSMPDVGGNFRDSQMGMTMRQRSLNAISTSQFNVRSLMGNEASHLNFG